MTINTVIDELDIKVDLKYMVDQYWERTFNKENINSIKLAYYSYANYVDNAKHRKLGVINDPLYKRYDHVLRSHFAKNYLN